MTKARIQIPGAIARNFANPEARFHILKGGRGSGKTRAAAAWCAVRAIQHASEGRRGVILCGREHLNSLDESSLPEIKEAILAHDWMASSFDVGEKYVRTACGSVAFAFAGLRHNLDSLKSKARILDAWIEEAEPVPETAWRKLIPTIREEGSKLVISYNPESEESATNRRFVLAGDPDICVTHINYDGNPWFPAVLEAERLRDMRNNPETYEHVWEGQFLTLTDAQVFSGKHRVEEFEPGEGWDGPYQGVDFGFRPDPLAALQCWIHDRKIYIRHEAYSAKVEIDDTASYITQRIKGFERYASRADSAEPKTISYLKRKGLPRIEPVKKWPNSIEEGIRFLRGYECIVIHPDCPGTARDFRLYSHKTDRNTGDILPDVIDANNHAVDALRYALAPIIKQQGGGKAQFRI